MDTNNASNSQARFSDIIQKGFGLFILIGLALVIVGRLLVPNISILSISGACMILAVYGLAGVFGFPRISPEIFNPAGIIGLLAGGIFAIEILLEYAILPKD